MKSSTILAQRVVSHTQQEGEMAHIFLCGLVLAVGNPYVLVAGVGVLRAARASRFVTNV